MKKKITPDQLAFAKSLYVFGIGDEDGKRVFPTLRRVAKRTKVPFSYLAERAQEENWLGERAFAHEEFYNRMKEEMIQKLVERSMALRTTIADGARVGANIVTARLGLIAREMARLQGKTKKARGYEMRDLGMALETFKRVGLDALGDRMSDEFTWRDLLTQAKGHKQDFGGIHEKRRRAEEMGDGEAPRTDTPPRIARGTVKRRSGAHSTAVT